jgi:plasmid replication initiation protein
MGESITLKNNDIVRKSEFLVKARYRLNPLALKFITTIIANLKRSDEIDKKYTFKVKDFADLMNVTYHDIYAEMEEAVEELLKKPLHIKEQSGWLKVNWISSARYKDGEGTISFRIDPDLRPYLLAVQEKFLQYRLENILKLRSGYIIRLYEILKDWYNTLERYNGTKKVEKIVELKWLRETLEIPNSYQYSSGIKLRILEKSKQEFKKYTDIVFDFEEIKTGRKVTHIKFIIEENPKNAKSIENKDKYSFLATKRSFINYLRKHYVNKAIIEAPNKNANGKISKWSISENGLIYDMYYIEENINASRSDEIYEGLYNFAKQNEDFKNRLADKKEFCEFQK